MAKDSLDIETLMIFPFAWGAATSLGLVEDTLIPFIDAGQELFAIGNLSFSIGATISALALIAVLIRRDESITDTAGIDAWAAYATLGLVLAPPLFPAFEATLAQTPAALLAFTVQSYGFMVVSYLN